LRFFQENSCPDRAGLASWRHIKVKKPCHYPQKGIKINALPQISMEEL